MAKKIKLEITEAQLEAIISITDECSSSIGMGSKEDDAHRNKCVMLVDRMLKKNGYKRLFE
tara:strand:+ start:254 stop:436 length:183 start_codon:yes stop_codon:yes gene_type:complete